jgi:hypothetical protein
MQLHLDKTEYAAVQEQETGSDDWYELLHKFTGVEESDIRKAEGSVRFSVGRKSDRLNKVRDDIETLD